MKIHEITGIDNSHTFLANMSNQRVYLANLVTDWSTMTDVA